MRCVFALLALAGCAPAFVPPSAYLRPLPPPPGADAVRECYRASASDPTKSDDKDRAARGNPRASCINDLVASGVRPG